LLVGRVLLAASLGSIAFFAAGILMSLFSNACPIGEPIRNCDPDPSRWIEPLALVVGLLAALLAMWLTRGWRRA
jgi:hypothetical protein